jgi:hypothetical protein
VKSQPQIFENGKDGWLAVHKTANDSFRFQFGHLSQDLAPILFQVGLLGGKHCKSPSNILQTLDNPSLFGNHVTGRKPTSHRWHTQPSATSWSMIHLSLVIQIQSPRSVNNNL